ncbi:MAG: hypothetical protein DRJ42_03755 [Deltaproteobacteria bacterium]|nr:MAG: hypothetical protein DRJ42_03755 [Deltaproteobacteria bacterium]
MTAPRRSLLAVLAWVLSLAGVGCSVGPDYVRPDTTALESFRAPTTTTESIVNLNWWELYDDPVLQRLIGTAIEHNRDARVALLRITESRLLAGIVRADLYPTLSAGGQLSAAPTITTNGDFAPVANAAFAVDMSYEVDLWGRVRRSNEAAFHEVLASEEAYRNVLISLIAEVAAQYFTLIDLDNRLAITEQTIAMRTRGLNTVEARFRGGLTTEIDFRQSEIQLHVVEASLASYRQFIGLTENSLSVLLGQPPRAIPRGRPLFSQVIPPAVPIGLPSEVVRRRPDIREAERRLHAQNARIGVARANRFPQFNLTGPAGVTAVLTNPSLATGFLTLGANLLSPLFNGGRLRRQEQIEVTRTEQLTQLYEQRILVAFSEVEDALIAHETLEDEFEARERQTASAQAAYDIVWNQYLGGLTTYLQVAAIQASLFSAQLALSQVRQEYLISVVSLYKALGGGWPVGALENDGPEASTAAEEEGGTVGD